MILRLEKNKGLKKAAFGVLMAVMAAFGAVSLGLAVAEPVMATNEYTSSACSSITDADQRAALGCDDGGISAPRVVINVLKVVLGIMGILAVVMIIVAGQRYATAMGEPAEVQKAKNMIVYSIVGLVVALLAFVIVNFVEALVFDAREDTSRIESSVIISENTDLLQR